MSALHVVFKVGNADYALAAADVLQMESFTSATPVPGAAAHVAGLVQVRGKVIPVVDARKRFGLAAIEHSLNSRVVVAQCKGRTVGLLVDSAREVMKLDEAAFKPPPQLLTDQAAGFVRSVAQVNGRLLLLIDLEKVIGSGGLHDELPGELQGG